MPNNSTSTQLSKSFGVLLNKEMRKQSDGTLLIRGYFTSDNKDEAGDIITRSATERAIPKYRQWGNIRLMHLPRPVAKVVKIGSEDGLEWNEVEIKVIDPEAVFMVENGLLTALSVGIMIKYDDIDFLEDGGWVINDYQFAEISLVDHPANYDAHLKQLPVDQGLRTLVRQYGMESIARSMQSMLDMEMAMTKNIESDAIVSEQAEDQIEEQVEETAADPEPQEEQVELSAEAEVEVAAEADLDAEAAVEEEAAEDEQAEEPSEEEAAPDFATMFQSLISEVQSLRGEVAELRRSLEVEAEAPEAEEQAEDDVEVERSIEPTEDEEAVGDPASREAAIPETTLPEAEDVVEDHKEAPVTDLRQALAKYFAAR